MIGKLRGIIDEISGDHLIIDVSGVGYIVFVSTRAIQSLPQRGNEISLLIHMQIREDSQNLYGFIHESEKEWFLKLISVKGVGPKLALTILSSLTPAQISSAIFAKDQSSLNKISGVGKKIAERIFIELKDKSLASDYSQISTKIVSNVTHTVLEDAVSALANLGYNRSESYNIASKIVKTQNDANLSEVIKLSLRELAR